MKKIFVTVATLFLIGLIAASVCSLFTGNPIKKIYHNYAVKEYLIKQYPYYEFRNIKTYYNWEQNAYYALSETVNFPQISAFKISFRKVADGKTYYTDDLCERVWTDEIRTIVEQKVHTLFHENNVDITVSIETKNKYSYIPLYKDVSQEEKYSTITIDIPTVYSDAHFNKVYNLVSTLKKHHVNHILVFFQDGTFFNFPNDEQF